jgi:hypothetical protein
MTERCESCNRLLTSAESRSLGFGPVCLERLRGSGRVVGGTARPSVLVRVKTRWKRRKPAPGQLPLEGMDP